MTRAILATARPDSWNVPLFVHVLGAMVLVGGSVTATSALAFAKGDVRLRLRLGDWTLLAVALPGYVIMRIGAQWIPRRSTGTRSPTTRPDRLRHRLHRRGRRSAPMLIALIVGGIGMRKLREGRARAY